MSKNSEHHDTYIIPPNFIEGSTLFGGMFKIRNVIEAGVLAAAVGVPVFSLDLSLTVRIIILCLTALPLALFALMGIAGEPLSSYIIAFFKWLKNRRVVGKTEPKEERKKPKPKKEKVWAFSVISMHFTSKGSSGAITLNEATTLVSPLGPIRSRGSVRSAFPMVRSIPGRPLM